jgi:hypothetical protein
MSTFFLSCRPRGSQPGALSADRSRLAIPPAAYKRLDVSDKCTVAILAPEKGGNALPFVFPTKGAALETLAARTNAGSTVHADEGHHWDAILSRNLTTHINHRDAYSEDGACTNDVEPFFLRIRRPEITAHRHIYGKYLSAYAHEMAWREDHRRVSNGEQYLILVTSALSHPVSRQRNGYWER